jgi:hypothetical protein
MSTKKDQFIIESQGDVTINGVVNLGKIKGDVKNSIKIIPENEIEIQSKLTQLIELIEQDAELPESQKEVAFEQIKTIADSVKNKAKDGIKQVIQQLTAKYVEATQAGDYFQVYFGKTRDGLTDYFLIQWGFEFEDETRDEPYIESDDMKFCGRPGIKKAELNRNRFYLFTFSRCK